jgi:hypothetical protein
MTSHVERSEVVVPNESFVQLVHYGGAFPSNLRSDFDD